MAKFTDRMIAALKPKADRYEIWEGAGFGVRVGPRGGKSWIYLYHFKKRPRRITFGTYPAMSLADARIKVAQARKQLEKRIDPGVVQVEANKAERLAETVEELVDSYLEKWARPRKRSAAEDERMLRKDVVPAWGRRKAKEVERKDVIALLDRIAERGAPIAANRTLAVVRRMFNWAISRDLVAANPCRAVKAPGEETSRDRVLSADEIRAFWRGLGKAAMSEAVRLALKLQLATAQRKGEVIAAEWSEFDIEGERVWIIPSEKAKNGLTHRVPLSPLALKLLQEVKAISGNSRWLFPSPRGDKPITAPAVDHAMRDNHGVLGIKDASPHDLRRSAATHMATIGTSRLVIGKLLNHAEPSVTAVYDRASYDLEKRQALEAWGRRLAEIISGKPRRSKVVELVRA